MEAIRQERQPDDSPFSKIWRKAIEDFARDTHIDLDSKAIPHPETVDQLIGILESSHTEFQTDVNRGQAFTKSLRLAIGPFTFLSGMFGGAAGMAFPPSSQILGAVTVLVNAGKSTTGAFDAVGGLFVKLSAFTARLNEVTQDDVSDALARILQTILSSMLGILALATKRTYHVNDGDVAHKRWEHFKSKVRSDVGEYLRQLLLGGDAEIDAAVSNLERLIDEEHRMTVTLIKVDTTRIKVDTTRIGKDTTKVLSATTRLEADNFAIKSDTTEIKSKLLASERTQTEWLKKQSEWLNKFNKFLQRGADGASNQSSSNTPKNDVAKGIDKVKRLRDILRPANNSAEVFEELKRERLTKTSNSISSDAVLHQWTSCEWPVLHFSAPEGTGKTFVAANIIQELLNRHKQGVQDPSRVSVAYYFCQDKLGEATDVCTMLQTLAYQITQNDEAYEQYILRKQKEINAFQDEVSSLWNVLFTTYFKDTRATAFIVIDGLNEVEGSGREDFIACLEGALSTGENRKWTLQIQLMLITDPAMDETIAEKLDNVSQHLAWDNRSDLQEFVDSKLRSEWQGSLVSSKVYQQAKDAIISAADGNFTLASLLADSVTSFSREKQVLDRLPALPRTLQEAIPLVLDRLERRLDKDELLDLRDMIGWVACSKRHLTLAELDAFLCLRSEAGDRVLDLEIRIRDQFASLFILSGDEDPSDNVSETTTSRRLTDAERLRLHESMEGEASEPKEASEDKLQVMDKAPNGEDKVSSRSVPGHAGFLDDRIETLKGKFIRFQHTLVAHNQEEEQTIRMFGGVHIGDLRLQVLTSCLNTICGNPSTHPTERDIASKYCALFLPEHLVDVEPDVAAAATPIKIEIAALLVKLLQDDSIISHWVGIALDYMVFDLLQSGRFTNSVRLWLEDAEVSSHFSDDDRSWVESVASNPIRVLLLGVARENARRWLMHRLDKTDTSFEFLDMYLDKSGILPIAWGETEPEYGLDNESMTPARILSVAEWAGLQQDDLWWSRLGWAYRGANFYDDSIAAYEHAIELKPDEPLLRSGLATTYNMKEDYESAARHSELGIQLIEDAVPKNLPTQDPTMDMQSYLIMEYQDLASYYLSLGKTDKATEWYMRTLDDWETCEKSNWTQKSFAAVACLRTLFTSERHAEAIELVRRFNNHTKRHEEEFFIVYNEMLLEADMLARLAFQTKHLDIVDTFMFNAICSLAKYGDDGHTSVMRTNRARIIRLIDATRQEEALVLAESILTDEEITMGDPNSMPARYLAVIAEKKLAIMYLDKILQARELDQWTVVGNYAERLISMVRKDTDGSMSDTTSARNCALILAAWERINGRKDRAVKFAKGKLVLGVDMLSDDDPLNDYLAWGYLADATLVLGDSERAATCWTMLLQIIILNNMPGRESGEDAPGETANEAPATTNGAEDTDTTTAEAAAAATPNSDRADAPSIEPAGGGTTDVNDLPLPDLSKISTWYCDGPCFRRLDMKDPVWRCTYCVTDFCADCHNLISEGKNEDWCICSIMHERIELPGFVDFPTADAVKVGNGHIQFKEWLKALADEYGIELSRQQESQSAVTDGEPDQVLSVDGSSASAKGGSEVAAEAGASEDA